MWKQAAGILLSGGVVVLPTDTVYGLAAHPGSAEAVRRLWEIKGRPAGKPVALLAAGIGAVRASGAVFPAAARALAERYWPGPLTLILRRGEVFEGFRVPGHPALRALLEACGGLLRVTSANFSGRAPAVTAEEARRTVGAAADGFVDGGDSPGGVASAVVRVAEDNAVEILREGAIPRAGILAAAGGGGPPSGASGFAAEQAPRPQ